MQRENKNVRSKLSDRYRAYVFAKRHLGGECCGKVFSVGENGQQVDELCGQQTNTFKARYEATGDGSYVVESKLNAQGIRRLTPIECERLQGFPDNWTKYGIMNGQVVEISDSQRYKCLGNAVTTNVVAEVVRRLFK